MLNLLLKSIRKNSDKNKALLLQRFFKTGKGQYGEGDLFLGLTVPQSREIALEFKDMPYEDLNTLLKSKYHEERLISLLILVHRYEKNEPERKKVFDFYLKNRKGINNWDLVDLSAPRIVGRHLYDNGPDSSILHQYAKSIDLWEKRIAIVSTMYFISKGSFDETLSITEQLMQDKHDLIHKACGWMLREVGKKDESVLKKFLSKHYKKMPRTMLRYAIERFPEHVRKAYLKGTIK